MSAILYPNLDTLQGQRYPHLGLAFDKNMDMSDQLRQHISRRLQSLMDENPNLDTLKKVSVKSGVGFGTVQRMQAGTETGFAIDKVEAVAKAFGLSLVEFLSEDQADLSNEALQVAKVYQSLPQDARLEIRNSITRAELAEKWKAQQSEQSKSARHG